MATAVARVRRTFIEYPVQPEFMDLSFMEDEGDAASNLRTQSDPTGENAEFAQPRKVLVPMRRVAEESSTPGTCPPPGTTAGTIDEEEDVEALDDFEEEEEEEDAVEEEEEELEEEEEGEGPAFQLARTQSVKCPPPGRGAGETVVAGLPAAPPTEAGSATTDGWSAMGSLPWEAPPPYLGYEAAPFAATGGCAWPMGPQVLVPSQPEEAKEPPFGQLHNFHREALQFCAVDQDLRTFTKGRHFHGRLSVVTENRVHKGGVQRYMVQLVAGSLSRADGIGFVFAQRLPCTKDIQKIVSVYLNQQGEIGMRLLSKMEKAREHLTPLEIGDWIEMSIDLDRHTVRFSVFRWNACAWSPSLQLVSSAEMDFSSMLPKLGGSKDLSVGYLACVVKNNGASMRLGS